MSTDLIVQSAINTVPKAVAAGIVNMASGQMLSIKTFESQPKKALKLFAPASEPYEGELASSIEAMLEQARGIKPDDRHFEEIMISSIHRWHFFGRLKNNPQAVLCVVTRGDVNLGLFLAKCRDITASAKLQPF